MNYMVVYDASMSWICRTNSKPDGFEVFSTLGAAKEVLLEYLRTIRNDYNNQIYQVKKMKLSSL